MEVVWTDKIRGVIFLTALLFSASVAAVTYEFPTDDETEPPFILPENDSLTVLSGNVMTTDSSLGYTINFQTDPDAGSGSTITVQSGATVSYTGDVDGAAISCANSTDTNSDYSIINNGIISATGDYAINLVNPAATADRDITINNNGSIIGGISIDGVNTLAILFGSPAPSISGQITIANVNTSATLTVQNNTSVTFNSLVSGPVALAVGSVGAVSGTGTVNLNGGLSSTDAVTVNQNSTLYINSSFEAASITTNTGSNTYFNDTTTLSGNLTASAGTILANDTVLISANDVEISQYQPIFTDVLNYGNINLNYNGTFNSFANLNPSYTGGYFAANTYTMMSSTNTIPTPAFTTPNNTMFLTFNTPQVTNNGLGTNLVVMTIDRTPYQTYAQTPITQAIATNLENIGVMNQTQGVVTVLNAVEASTSVTQLETALNQFIPLAPMSIYTINIQHQAIRESGLRLAGLRNRIYVAGDENPHANFWLRSFGGYGNQAAVENSTGFYGSNWGFLLGYDQQVIEYFTSGLALGYVNAHIKDKRNTSSYTDIKGYLAMWYGTFNFDMDTYLDLTASFLYNHNNSNRLLSFSTANFNAVGSYNYSQFAATAIYGMNYCPVRCIVVTPELITQYTFVNRYSYTETNGLGASLAVNPDAVQVLQFGGGIKLSRPEKRKGFTVVPDVHARALYNVFSPAQNTIFSFVAGGTPMTSYFTGSKWEGIVGASMLIVSCRCGIELKFNADYDIQTNYKGYNLYADLKWRF